MADAKGYKSRFTSSYQDSKKRFNFRRTNDNYAQLSRELTALGHRADAEDMMETVKELNDSSIRRATHNAQRRDFMTHTAYVTIDRAIEAYKQGKIKEKQFDALLYRAQAQLQDALLGNSPEGLRKKKPGELRLVDIVRKEVLKQAAAILAFIFALLSFDQVRLTGAAIGGAGSYDYYSLFGFLFLALGILLLLMRKDN